MPSQEDIENQRRLLATHRATLRLLLNQQARFGFAYLPQHIWHALRETRAEIARCKAALREYGAGVEDLPAEDEPADGYATLPEQASAGLDALVDLMHAPAARSAVAIYRANFETASHQIGLLAGYKRLHDQFQQLEDCHAILARCCKTAHTDANLWYDLEENEPQFYDTATELLADASDPLFGQETATWTPRLARAMRELRGALERQHIEDLRDVLRRIKDTIGRQLSRTNLRLAGVAEALQLGTLIGALEQISAWLDHATSADQQRLDDVRRGVAALGNLNQRLLQSIHLHRAFQDFDDELRRVEGALEQSLAELADAWPDLAPMMQSICAGAVAEWATRLRALGADVEQLLPGGEPIKLHRAFGRYRSHATICFNRIDFDLRNLCSELQQIGAPLDRVLKVIE